MTDTLLTTATTLVVGCLAGLFLCSSLMEHAARQLNAGNWTAYKQAKETVFGPVMPPFFLTGLAAASVAAAFAPAHAAYGVAALLLAAVFAITLLVHLPLNKRIQSWDAAAPADWDAVRRRWRGWNWMRCALTLLAFGAVVAATLP